MKIDSEIFSFEICFHSNSTHHRIQKPPLPDTGLRPLKRRDVFVDGAFYKDCVIFTVFDYSLCLLCFKSYFIRNMLVKLSRLHAEGNLKFHIFSQTSAAYLNNSNVTAKEI